METMAYVSLQFKNLETWNRKTGTETAGEISLNPAKMCTDIHIHVITCGDF